MLLLGPPALCAKSLLHTGNSNGASRVPVRAPRECEVREGGGSQYSMAALNCPAYLHTRWYDKAPLFSDRERS
eukprot:554979-Prymnesium_polylepis.1